MNACRARQLRQTADALFDFLLAGHHQIRQFVDDNHDARHRLFVLIQRFVVAVDGADAFFLELVVAVHHFPNCPRQRAARLVRVGHHRNQQVRNAVVALQFNHLRVNENHADFLGRTAVQKRIDDCVDAHGFA